MSAPTQPPRSTFACPRRERRRRRSQEGMTLLEIMVVMTIIALMAGAAAFAFIPQLTKAKVRQTSADAKTIASAAELYMSENDECPSVAELISTKTLKQSVNTQDAWGNDFAVECNEDGAMVRSAGPDEQMGTDDDIQ